MMSLSLYYRGQDPSHDTTIPFTRQKTKPLQPVETFSLRSVPYINAYIGRDLQIKVAQF